MRTWKLWCVAGGLFTCLVVWTAAKGQAPQDPFAAKPPEPTNLQSAPSDSQNRSIDPLVAPTAPFTAPGTVPAPGAPAVSSPAPKPPTIDEMLDQLADIRAKKAELEKQEQATIKALREKFKAHKERLSKMGVALEEPPAKAAEGNADLLPKIELPAVDAAKNPEKK